MGVSSSAAGAQAAVGAGPLTATLTDTAPETGVLKIGPVRVAPGLTVQQLGWDDNVFNEPETESPKEDFVAEAQPDVAAFSSLRFVRFSAYAAAPMIYFHTYESERSIGYDARARVDLLLGRLRPFVGYGQADTQNRPNGEIDARVERVDQEVSGGLAFDLSAHSVVYGSAYQSRHEFEEAFDDGNNLANLTHDGYNYEGGIKTDLTPLLSMQVFGSYHEDRFPEDPTRNSLGKSITTTFRFDPAAVVTGIVTASYHDIHYADPGLEPFRGMMGSAALTYPILEIGRLSAVLRRGVEYSYDAVEAYYVESSAEITYTHRLVGEVDVQGRVSRAQLNYSARPTQPEHTDTLDAAAGGLGYNLRNRTRVALNYEYARRKSPAFAARNYQRRRVFVSWLFAF
jgi:hypothetical protein